MGSVNVQPGEFIKPSGALLRSASDENEVVRVWEEVGECFGYPKPDGWRFQVHKIGSHIKLFSRTGKDYAEEFPSIVQMIRTQVEDDLVILDTELVGFDRHGHHLEPAKLRKAAQFRCYLLDALCLRGYNLASLPTLERVSLIQKYLHDAIHDIFIFAEYTFMKSQEDLVKFYQQCLSRREEGFDGAIIKRFNATYFTNVLKVKPEETIDAIVAGAFREKQGPMRTLLLVVPSYELNCLVPFAKATLKKAEWESVWKACQDDIVEHRPENLGEFADSPDLWINPRVVTMVTIKHLYPDESYLVRGDYVKKCVLREDKGPEDATSLEQILQTADLTEIMEALRKRAKQKQLSFFMDNDSAEDDFSFAEDEETSSFENTSLAEAPLQEKCFNNEDLVQLRFGLFE